MLTGSGFPYCRFAVEGLRLDRLKPFWVSHVWAHQGFAGVNPSETKNRVSRGRQRKATEYPFVKHLASWRLGARYEVIK